MRLMFILTALLLSSTAHCQENGPASEVNYDFSSNGKIDVGRLDIDSVFEVKARLKIIRDARFFLLLFQDVSFSNTMFSNNGSEEEPDSLLFDMNNKTVYNFKENKAYKYSERLYQLPKINGDSVRFQKGDTLIEVSKTLGKGLTPTPTIAALPYGIKVYSTRRFSFKYVSSKQTLFSLSALYRRCVHFKLYDEKFQFTY